jgi:hypothetical protein
MAVKDADVRVAVATSYSMNQAIRKLRLDPRGRNYPMLRKKIELLQLDTSHWKTLSELLGAHRGKARNISTTIPLSDILVESSTYVSIGRLKIRLIREGLLNNSCYVCQIQTWCGKPLSLQLDHKNGVPNDHRLPNLRLLCPNCHSQTETYCGRNKK